ncbi:hypothetical protein CMQ_446 [Grosmannia clavigera kw1407]|uniref:Uncharacterized protein n=1 Tax=Grosmannia clavigera (strain kw1407 / UAMH 11150) TaxID=655863 RepID=F0XF76_GROCL|nr:uncharacterized protein CMQ_446 [Grosmannia clavigera kw1407]EFX03518.1 hypothetical protein CMQ_446 [Grosmannia clavigera kw1407]
MSSRRNPRQVKSAKRWLKSRPARDVNYHVHSLRSLRSLESDGCHPHARAAEALLRIVAACLASVVVSTCAVTQLLVRVTSPLTTTNSRLDLGLSWVIGVPVGGLTAAWQLSRLFWLLLEPSKNSRHQSHRPALLLAADVLVEIVLCLGAAICAILAGFQAARHLSFNRTHKAISSASARTHYHDVGPEIALTALLGLLMLSSFGILGLVLSEACRWRRSSSTDSSSSSVIEIIPRR